MRIEDTAERDRRFDMDVRGFLSKPPFCYRNVSEQDLRLFRAALTHDSYANEAADRGEKAESYERLEFLGDAVLELLVCDHVYSRTALSEGRMTDFKQEKVDNDRISEMVLDHGMDIDGALRVGNVQIKDGVKDVQAKMRADAFEALIAAVYLTRGLDEARRVVCEVERLRWEAAGQEGTTIIIGVSHTEKVVGSIEICELLMVIQCFLDRLNRYNYKLISRNPWYVIL